MNDPTLPDVSFSEQDGVRYLHLGTPWVQGAMRLRTPHKIELDYIQRMLAVLLWRAPETLDQGRALHLGLGAATLTRFTRQALGWPTLAVELNPQVVAACRAWFHLPPDDEQLQVHLADAGVWIQDPARQGSVDLLFVDLYDEEAAAPVLDDEDFYRQCRSLLAPGGLMAVNLFGRQSTFQRSGARIAQAFGPDQVWQVQPTREGNTVVIAGVGAVWPDAPTLASRAQDLAERFKPQGLPAKKWLKLVSPWRP
jgi:spermidine synthase